MNYNNTTRRQWLAAALSAALPGSALAAAPQPAAPAKPTRPFRIYAITFRGMTDVEKGFSDYFASRKIPVQITYRDLNREPARDFIRDIPVVFTLVAAPTLARIVPDLKMPGRNVTGVVHVGSTEGQIKAMAQYRPFQTLGVLYTPTEKNSVVLLDEIRRLGREQGFHTVERTFRLDAARKPIPDGAADLVRELKDAGAQWLYLPPDSYLGTLAESVIVPAAMQLGLPTFASTEQLMQAGALSGLVSRYYNVGQFTAHKAEQILVDKHAPAAIPVETLKRFSYQIRMPAAKRLNLPPPLPMLSYAELITSETVPQQ
jgi:putative tryptophan/tyrosine transport system substrate-binding protein